jgi:hypothetical protein
VSLALFDQRPLQTWRAVVEERTETPKAVVNVSSARNRDLRIKLEAEKGVVLLLA